MLKALVEKLVSLGGAKLLTKSARGTEYHLPAGADKVICINPDAPFRVFGDCGTVGAFCAHIGRYLKPDKTAVCVSPSGCRAMSDETGYSADSQIFKLPFFAADLPEGSYDHAGFLDYLDQHAEHIEGGAEILETLRAITIAENEKATSRETGASIAVEFSGGKGISGATATLPKYINIGLRRGTREYQFIHRFRLHVDSDGRELRFRLVHINRDGAEDAFLQRCLADVRATLGPEWHVIQGAD